MPKDSRVFITITVDMPRNPKLAALSGAQKWLIVEALCHCREYLTDGAVDIATWKKMGRKRDRDAILETGIAIEFIEGVAIPYGDLAPDGAKLLSEYNTLTGHSLAPNCVLFLDYSEHQQLRAEVEEMQEKRRSAGRKGGLSKAARAGRTATEPLASATANANQTPSKNVPELDIREKNTSYVPSAALVSNAGASAPADERPGKAVPVDGWRIIKPHCGHFPQATRTALATEAAAMLKQGIDPDDITAGLVRWLTKDLGPRQLPHMVTDVIRAKTRPTATTPTPGDRPQMSNHDRKTLGWAEAAAEVKRSLGITPTNNTPLPSAPDRPLLEILSSDEYPETA